MPNWSLRQPHPAPVDDCEAIAQPRARVSQEILKPVGPFTRGLELLGARARTSDADGGPTIVVLQDFCVSLALICHDCRADLA